MVDLMIKVENAKLIVQKPNGSIPKVNQYSVRLISVFPGVFFTCKKTSCMHLYYEFDRRLINIDDLDKTTVTSVVGSFISKNAIKNWSHL